MALSLPATSEAAHMGHPDFRVGGKIFATLAYTNEALGMVKLTPGQQALYVQADPEVFLPVKGGWGRQGCTHVRLESATENTLRKALVAAWRNTAPKRVAEKFDVE
jgi:hypothetical protein